VNEDEAVRSVKHEYKIKRKKEKGKEGQSKHKPWKRGTTTCLEKQGEQQVEQA
jgi:hypothetical protein